jgi:hypothetical protein
MEALNRCLVGLLEGVVEFLGCSLFDMTLDREYRIDAREIEDCENVLDNSSIAFANKKSREHSLQDTCLTRKK